MIEGTVNTAIECFTLGLESEIATRMIGKQFSTLEVAISTAITCERYVQQQRELHGIGAEENRKRAYCHIAGPQKEDEPDRKKFSCYRCGEAGHIARNCRSVENSGPYCGYCKIGRHSFEACRRRARNAPSRNGQQLAIDYPPRSSTNNNSSHLNSKPVHPMGAMMDQPRRGSSSPIPTLLSLPMIPPRG